MSKELWFDMTIIKSEKKALLLYAVNMGYDGLFMDKNSLDLLEITPSNVKIIYRLDEDNAELPKQLHDKKIVVASDNSDFLRKYKNDKKSTCYIISVKDKKTMNQAIQASAYHEYILVKFEDATNIPLELIVAFSQQTKSKIFKNVINPEDGWVATMTMEQGSFGVLLSNRLYDNICKLSEYVKGSFSRDITFEKLFVERIQHIGMGDRICIDTISKLEPDEGMLIGSTSKGGILVSSENHFLPYMDLRPFRVNAGAIHSYIFCENNTTKYLSELKAGDTVLVVNTQGKARTTAVGRIKMERRPMLLIECKDNKKNSINVIVQDDWHIRLLGENMKVYNATELKKGDILLGIVEEPGRHLGVKISESIIEK